MGKKASSWEKPDYSVVNANGFVYHRDVQYSAGYRMVHELQAKRPDEKIQLVKTVGNEHWFTKGWN